MPFTIAMSVISQVRALLRLEADQIIHPVMEKSTEGSHHAQAKNAGETLEQPSDYTHLGSEPFVFVSLPMRDPSSPAALVHCCRNEMRDMMHRLIDSFAAAYLEPMTRSELYRRMCMNLVSR